MTSVMKKPTKGFCFGGRALDGKTIVYVNVCGHEDIQPPQGPSGAKVDDDYIDKMGVDNLQIPIAVGNPVEVDSARSTSDDNNSKTSDKPKKVQEVTSSTPSQQQQPQSFKQFIVEVVIHRMIADRCRCVWNTGGTPKDFDEKVQAPRKMIVFRIAKLALDWVQRETGIVVAPDSVRLMFNTAYQTPPTAAHTSSEATGKSSSVTSALPSPAEMMEFMKRMAEKRAVDGNDVNLGDQNRNSNVSTEMDEMMNKMQNDEQQKQQQQKRQQEPSTSSSRNVLSGEDERTSFIFSTSTTTATTTTTLPTTTTNGTKKPLIQEVTTSKKSSQAVPSVMRKGFLNNTGGSLYGDKGTGEGVLPDGAGDPIGYMPKSFRDKCKVVDMRTAGNDTELMLKAMEAAEKTSISGKPITAGSSPQQLTTSSSSSATTAPTEIKNNDGAPKMTFSHQQQQLPRQEGAEKLAGSKMPIVIEEVETNDDATCASSSSVPSTTFNFYCAPEWSLVSAKIDVTSNLVLSLKASSPSFNIAELDLEVTPNGLKAQQQQEQQERGGSGGDGNEEAAAAAPILFCLGDCDATHNQTSLFTISDWKKMISASSNVDVEDLRSHFGAETDQNRVRSLDSDSAKAKFKKATKELILTIPLV